LVVQVKPEFVETHVEALEFPPPASTVVPSGEQVIAHVPPGAGLDVQSPPELVVMRRSPKVVSANIREPSAEQATDLQVFGARLFEIQLWPPSVEVYMGPCWLVRLAAATSLVPSAEDATAVQTLDGALVCIHVLPELVER